MAATKVENPEFQSENVASDLKEIVTQHIGLLWEMCEKDKNTLETIRSDVEWLLNRTQLSLGCLVAGHIYLERFRERFPNWSFPSSVWPMVYVTLSRSITYTAHLTLTALLLQVAAWLLASKIVEDDYHSNVSWANVRDIDIVILNKFEWDFASGIGYRFFVSRNEYLLTKKRLSGEQCVN